MKCTGACCREFTLVAGKRGHIDAHQVRVSGHPQVRPFRHLVVVLERGKAKGFGRYHVFTCRELSPDGRCRIHERKPEACSAYPSAFRCRYCGAASDAEARGVAIGPYDRLATS
jgi:Fe-S-cluster containining protein